MSTILELLARYGVVDLVNNYSELDSNDKYELFKKTVDEFGNNKIEIISKEEYDECVESINESRKEFTNPKFKKYKRFTNKQHLINSTSLFLNFVNKDSSESRRKIWNYLLIPYTDDLLKKMVHEVDS